MIANAIIKKDAPVPTSKPTKWPGISPVNATSTKSSCQPILLLTKLDMKGR